MTDQKRREFRQVLDVSMEELQELAVEVMPIVAGLSDGGSWKSLAEDAYELAAEILDKRRKIDLACQGHHVDEWARKFSVKFDPLLPDPHNFGLKE